MLHACSPPPVRLTYHRLAGKGVHVGDAPRDCADGCTAQQQRTRKLKDSGNLMQGGAGVGGACKGRRAYIGHDNMGKGASVHVYACGQ